MNCSGRGDLVDGVCVCYDGWASTGDMRSQIGLDCDVTTVYVRLGFALGMLIIGIAFLQSGLTRVERISEQWWFESATTSQ